MKISVVFIVLAYFTLKAHSAALGFDTPEEHVSLLTREKRFDNHEARQSDLTDPSAAIETNGEDETPDGTETDIDDDTKADKQKPPKVKPPRPPKGKDPQPPPPAKVTTTTPAPPPKKTTTPAPPPPPPPPPPTKKPVKPYVFPTHPPPPQPQNPYSLVDPTNPFGPHQYPAPSPNYLPPQQHQFAYAPAPLAPLPHSDFYEPANVPEFDAPAENSYRQSHQHSKARSQEESNAQNMQNTQLGAVYAPPVYAPPSYAPQNPAYAHPNYPPVQCPQNLLIGCAPQVQYVPCSAYSPAPYSVAPPPAYGPAHAYPAKPSYRYAAEEGQQNFAVQPHQNFNEQEETLGEPLGSTPENRINASQLNQNEGSSGATINSDTLVGQQMPNLPQQIPQQTPQSMGFSQQQQQMRQMGLPQNSGFPQQQQMMMTNPGLFRQQAPNAPQMMMPQQFSSNAPQMMMPPSAAQFGQQEMAQQDFVGQPNPGFNEQMVGDSYNLNFFRDSVDPELYGEGRYHASHHAHHGHHKKHHKNNHHSKHPHHHKTTTQPHDEDLEADNILTGNPLTTPTDNTKSEDKIKTDEIVPKPEKDVEIKREEAEEGNEKNIGDTMGNESTVGQQAPNMPQDLPHGMRQMPEAQAMTQSTAFSHQQMRQMEAPQFASIPQTHHQVSTFTQTLPMQQTVSHHSMRQMEVPEKQGFSQQLQPSMMTHPMFFRQQAPQMMRQMPETAPQFAHQQTPTTEQQFGQHAMAQQEFVGQPQHGFNEMVGSSKFDPSEFMEIRDALIAESGDSYTPFSFHHKNYLKPSHHKPHVKIEPSDDFYANIYPKHPKLPKHHVEIEPDTNGYSQHVKTPKHHAKFGKNADADEITPKDETDAEREAAGEENEASLGATMDSEPLVGQQAPQMPFNVPQMIRQMPEMHASPMMSQQMPQPMGFSQPQMRQMGAPEFQQTPPMMMQQTVPFSHPSMRQMDAPQFATIQQTHQQAPTFMQPLLGQFPMPPQPHIRSIPQRFSRMDSHVFAHQDMRQMEEDPRIQQAHMNQMEPQEQQPNQQHFVGMGNPMAEHMQFAASDSTMDAQYY